MSPADGDVSESLSDIDDAEVVGYLNSKQAALFKRMIWEAMNKDYDKEKSRKRARMAKKATRAKKPEKAVKVSTVMDTKNRLSSKINYDALDKLNEELGYAPAFEEGTKSNCGNPGDMQLSNEKNNFEGSHDDDFEHESNGYSEEVEARQGHDDDTYVANDQYNGCNYDDEYNYDEECDFDEL
ncbi:hypothetical protein PRUPE_4G104400 [Prunus persica]|uniref:Brf1 TBP-binding domain-containing protein n=2 Tax=Prunus persica TaxID=3760 RepID=A0A251PLR9_PRUPE|nr:uncharacterized protein LOC109948398 isoform X1 [Prunus persica]ONI11385.1 hypothetical protein PRUPE_4G104400 [Prunus persica]